MNWKYLHKIRRKRKLLHTFYFLQSTDFSLKNNKKSWSDFCLVINYEWVGWCAAVGSLKTRLNLPLVFFKEILDTWDVFISILFFLFKWMYAASWSFSQVKCSPRGNHTMSSRCVYYVASHNAVSGLNSIKTDQETITVSISHHFWSAWLLREQRIASWTQEEQGYSGRNIHLNQEVTR